MTNTELRDSPGRQLWLHGAMPAFISKKAYYNHYILLGYSYLQWMTLLQLVPAPLPSPFS